MRRLSIALLWMFFLIQCGGSDSKTEPAPDTSGSAQQIGVGNSTQPAGDVSTSGNGQVTQINVQPGAGNTTGQDKPITPASVECLAFCTETCQKIIDCNLAAFGSAEDCKPDCKNTIEQSRIDDASRCSQLKAQHTTQVTECGQLITMIKCAPEEQPKKLELGIVITYLGSILSGTDWCDFFE